jgi:Ion channel
MMVGVTPDAPDAPDHPADPDDRDTSDILELSRRQALRLATRAPDSYVLLLVLLVADYVLLTVGWSGGAALVVRTLLFALTVLLTFHTSRVGPRVQRVARVLVAVAVLTSLGVAISTGDEAYGAVTFLVSLLLLACPLAIGWRILHHERVTGETIAGAICIYVLIGMIFANLDYGIQLASGSDFFAQAGSHGLPDFAYFSYITMTTVGYGDLTPRAGLPRTMAVMDAMVGQVFLVVMLARLVSLYAGPRGWRRSLQERLRDEEQPADAPEG